LNFFAHAYVALWRRRDPPFVLGAMLPDFSGMLGLGMLDPSDRELAAGIEYHHATDAAFHRAPLFVALCAQAIAELTAAGVARGSARAVGHVGTELILDGLLSGDVDARAAYTQALQVALDERTPTRLNLQGRSAERWREGMTRLSAAPVPQGYRDPAFACARLHWILGQRPRLATRDQDLPSVLAFLQACQARLTSDAPVLLEQVRAGLIRADAHA
jgi:hypothetical protein